MVYLIPSVYVTYLAISMEALSSHVTKKCVTSSFTLQNNPSPLPAYVASPPSTRAEEDQRRRHVRVGGGLETRVDVLTQGLWEILTDAITNVIFGNFDTDTYKNEPMYKLLDYWEN